MNGAAARVPVEHRWAFLDRRTILPAAVVLLVGALWVVVMPAINSLIQVSRPVMPGTVLAAGPQVSFTPAVGWEIVSGVSAGHAAAPSRAEVADGGTRFEIRQVVWSGSLQDLFSRAARVNAIGSDPGNRFNGARTSVTTNQGVTGIGQPFLTGEGPGELVALLRNGVGAVVITTGPADQNAAVQQPIDQMQASIVFADPGGPRR